jgi:hypothetical protein
MNISGQYKKVWKVEVLEKLVKCDIGDSVKKADGTYENFTHFGVAFLGKCKDQAATLQEGDTIHIVNGLWSKKKSEKDNKYYDNVVVFEFEVIGSAKPKNDDTPLDGFQAMEDDDDIPF